MASRPVYLFVYGRTSKSRGHFAIFIPNAADVDQLPSKLQPCIGTKIHVVGNPFVGFYHEFKRNYNTLGSQSPGTVVLLGHVQSSLHVEPSSPELTIDNVALGALDAAALEVPAPDKAMPGLLSMVRCQEWTTEYVQYLVSLGYLDSSAVQLVQEQRDPPTHGVMLRRGGGGESSESK